jgi:hypothetical protein
VPTASDPWLRTLETKIEMFAKRYKVTYARSEREISASFEIGCFHALTEFYERTFSIDPQNLTKSNEYRYLTSPNGNPHNFSYIRLTRPGEVRELRQQVRIRSHLHDDIAFTPDMVVIREGADVGGLKDVDYAGGKRAFFCVRSEDVIAAHECKSMNPFPELLVSFVGMLVTAHAWLDGSTRLAWPDAAGLHLAPTLFIGGSTRALHLRMLRALSTSYPINIVAGLHAGTWSLLGGSQPLNLLQT